MKTLKILLLLVTVVAFASTAMAGTVNITGAINGTYTLNSVNLTTDASGNITTINLAITSGTPPPGGLSLSLNPTTLSAATQGTAYSQNVAMSCSGGTSPYTYSCSGSGNGLTASSNGYTCTISGTPTASGSLVVAFNAHDSATPQATVSNSMVVSINSNTSPPTGAVNIGAKYPPNVYTGSIPANGENHYYFVLGQSAYAVEVDMLTADWGTNQDLIVSAVRQPLCSDIVGRYANGPIFWYGPGSNSNETVTIGPNVAPGTIYVTVCNRSATTGKFKLYWTTY